MVLALSSRRRSLWGFGLLLYVRLERKWPSSLFVRGFTNSSHKRSTLTVEVHRRGAIAGEGQSPVSSCRAPSLRVPSWRSEESPGRPV